jgi:hypothetical protein
MDRGLRRTTTSKSAGNAQAALPPVRKVICRVSTVEDREGRPAMSRTVEDRECDYKALDMKRRGFNLRQIATECGWSSPQSAANAITRALKELTQVDADEVVRLMRERLDEYCRQAWRVLSRPHFVTTPAGVVARHPETNAPLVDDGPVLQALDRLLRYDVEERKMLGVDAPTKTRVEVITESDVDAAIRALVEKHAEADLDGLGLEMEELTGGTTGDPGSA